MTDRMKSVEDQLRDRISYKTLYNAWVTLYTSMDHSTLYSVDLLPASKNDLIISIAISTKDMITSGTDSKYINAAITGSALLANFCLPELADSISFDLNGPDDPDAIRKSEVKIRTLKEQNEIQMIVMQLLDDLLKVDS